jgi:dihydroorotate dehydrogenase electron transfer subunit
LKQVLATVISNIKVMPDFSHPQGKTVLGSRLMWLACPKIARETQPGQFIMVRCGADCLLPRPFSVHQVNAGTLALFFAVLAGGKGTNWLAQREPGDRLEIFGPLGNGFTVNQSSKNLLLVAGGIGIAPLYLLAQDALTKGCAVKLLLGAQTASQLYPGHFMPHGVELFTATDDGTAGERGRVTGLIPRHINGADQVFACGPLSMYRDMAQKQRELGLEGKPVQISLEVVMGCGHGVCYGCTIRTKQGLRQVCQDGPVFDLDDIIWDKLDF